MAEYIVNKTWNIEKLLTVLDIKIVDQICGIHIPMNDSFVWGCSLNEEFTIKSATWIENPEVNPREYSSSLKKFRNQI